MTECIFKLADWQQLRKSKMFDNCSLGFVPTMGNLHAGHKSLLQHSIRENHITALSIFINPTQFNEITDLKNYPRTLEADINLAKEAGVDFILIPEYQEIYPDKYRYKVSENEFSKILCGKNRPGHFDGVLTIVLKLLMLVKPHHAYFGEKDYQQLQLIKEMVKAFFIDAKIIACPTIRNEQGLALSSRNSLLTKEELESASLLSAILTSSLSIPEMKDKLMNKGFIIDYIEEHLGRRFAAVRLGNVRLIDNVLIDK